MYKKMLFYLSLITFNGVILATKKVPTLKDIATKTVALNIHNYPKSTRDCIPDDLIPHIMQEDYMHTFDPIYSSLDQETAQKICRPSHPYDQSLLHSGALVLSFPETTTLFKTLLGHTQTVVNNYYSQDKRYMATGSKDCTAKLWDLSADEIQLTPILSFESHTDWVNSVALNNDSSLLATASSDGTAKIWDTSDGVCLHTLKGHEKRINSVAFSNDGTSIVTASDDQLIIIWDTDTGTQKHILTGHTNDVLQATFACNDQKIVSLDIKNNSLAWDLKLSRNQCFERWKNLSR